MSFLQYMESCLLIVCESFLKQGINHHIGEMCWIGVLYFNKGVFNHLYFGIISTNIQLKMGNRIYRIGIAFPH